MGRPKQRPIVPVACRSYILFPITLFVLLSLWLFAPVMSPPLPNSMHCRKRQIVADDWRLVFLDVSLILGEYLRVDMSVYICVCISACILSCLSLCVCVSVPVRSFICLSICVCRSDKLFYLVVVLPF